MNEFLGKHIYFFTQYLRKEPVKEKLKEVLSTQHLSRKELEKVQQERLKKVLMKAYEACSFYKKRFDDCKFNPYSFTKEDFQRIPLLTRQEIKENQRELTSKQHKGSVFKGSTGGSSGSPLSFLHDRTFDAYNRAVMYREHAWAGLGVGAKEARFYGMPLKGIVYGKERVKDVLMNRKRFVVFFFSDEDMLSYWKQINQYQPTYLYGYVSAIARFSDFIKRKKLDLSWKPKAVIVTSEVLSPEERTVIEEVWKSSVLEEYGCAEVGIIASQHPDGHFYVNEDTNFVEVLHEGKPCAPGQRGEVVVTNLHNTVMPFIRYKVGDVAYLAKEQGKLPFTGLERIEGRLNNMLVTPEGRVVSGWWFYYLCKQLMQKYGTIQEVRIHQKKKERLLFLIVARKKNEDQEEAIKTLIKEELSPAMNASFSYVEEIPPLKSGKRLLFVSELKTDLAGNQK